MLGNLNVDVNCRIRGLSAINLLLFCEDPLSRLCKGVIFSTASNDVECCEQVRRELILPTQDIDDPDSKVFLMFVPTHQHPDVSGVTFQVPSSIFVLAFGGETLPVNLALMRRVQGSAKRNCNGNEKLRDDIQNVYPVSFFLVGHKLAFQTEARCFFTEYARHVIWVRYSLLIGEHLTS